MATPKQERIEIPTTTEGDVVDIDLSEISPENRADVDSIREVLLSAEVAIRDKPGLFLDFALEFYKRGMFPDFENFLRTGIEASERVSDPAGLAKLDALKVCLAAYETRKALSVKDVQTPAKDADRKRLLEQATIQLNRASAKNPLVVLGKGLLLLSQGAYDNALQAVSQYTKAGNNVVALMARAGLLYHRKDYKGALSAYQTVLRIVPKLKKPNPRIGIGLCYYQLGYVAEARKALLRAEEMDRANDTIAAVLMQMDLAAYEAASTAEDKQAFFSSAVDRYKSSRSLNTANPLANVFRAEQLFLSGDMTSARQYVNSAYQHTDFPQLRSKAVQIAGKVHHIQGNYDMALRQYERALSEWPDNKVNLYLSAQTLLQQKQYDKCIEIIDAGLAFAPNDPNFLKLLVYVHARRGDVNKALAKWDLLQASLKRIALQEASVTTPTSAVPKEVSALDYIEDYDFCLELARLCEKTGKLEMAVLAYQRATTIAEKTGEPIPAAIWNNLGALSQILNRLDDAQTYYRNALQAVTEGETTESTTVLYNIGRMHEALSEPDKALGYYQRILEKHPQYNDALLRVGAIDWARGKTADAKNKFSDVTDVDPSNVDAHIMIGLLQYSDGQLPLSRKTFESILQGDRNETYSLVQFGNLLVEEARGERSRTKKAELYQKALGSFTRAISIDEYNSYAAEGIGIVCAETGDLQEAERVFEMLKHNAPNLQWARINHAHTLEEIGVEQTLGDPEKQKQLFQAAITEYETAFRVQPSTKTLQSLHGASRAYYILGRADKNLEQLAKALEYAEEALRQSPNNKDLMYDVAQIKLFYGFSVEQRAKDQRTVEDVERGIEYMKIAGETFRNMSAAQPSLDLHMDHKTLKVKAEYCEKTTEELNKALEIQKVYEQKVKEQARQQELERELEQQRLEKEKLEAEERRKREEEEKYERRKAELLANQERIALEKEREAEKAAAQKERKSKKKATKKDDFVDDDEVKGEDKSDESEAQDSDGDKKPKGKKTKRKRREASQESVDSAQEDGGSKRSKKKKMLSEERVRDSDSDEDMEDAPPAEENRSPARLKLKRRVAESDDEDGDGSARQESAKEDAKEGSAEPPSKDASDGPTGDDNDDDGVGGTKRRRKAVISDDEDE